MICVENILERNQTGLENFCGCLPECNKIEYNFEVIAERHYYFGYLFTNISASIQFIDDEFIAYRRFESYGTVSLLSNIGGMLGLFLGISVLSVVEMFYFVTIRLFNDARSKLFKF